ncbi:hypothetical protein [Mycobacterium sp. MUNTM1]
MVDQKGCRIVELTRRNLEVLLAKLDDPLSARGLIDGDGNILVRAVENDADRGDTSARTAALAEGVVELTRTELHDLLTTIDGRRCGETTLSIAGGACLVRAVENAAHYRLRTPGVMWMPSTGEVM